MGRGKGNYETKRRTERADGGGIMRPKSEMRGSWVDLREVSRDKERGLYGETTSSDRESEGTSAEDSV